MAGSTDPEMDALKRRIEAAKKKTEGSVKPPAPSGSQAYKMSAELVVGTLVGAALGYGFDELFGTLPLMTIFLLLLGFAAGVRNSFRVAKEMQAQALETAQNDKKEMPKEPE